jgi:hypothetical protein
MYSEAEMYPPETLEPYPTSTATYPISPDTNQNSTDTYLTSTDTYRTSPDEPDRTEASTEIPGADPISKGSVSERSTPSVRQPQREQGEQRPRNMSLDLKQQILLTSQRKSPTP